MSARRIRSLVPLAVATAVLAATATTAEATAPTVSAQRQIAAPHVSPYRVAGTDVRPGHHLHGREILIVRDVVVHRNIAHLRLTCPAGHVLRGIGSGGHVGLNLLGQKHYAGHRTVRLRGGSTLRPRKKHQPAPATAHGTAFALCS